MLFYSLCEAKWFILWFYTLIHWHKTSSIFIHKKGLKWRFCKIQYKVPSNYREPWWRDFCIEVCICNPFFAVVMFFFFDIWKVASYIWSLKCDIYDRIFSRLCYMMIAVLLLGPRRDSGRAGAKKVLDTLENGTTASL